ncbi:prolipoprotein diacylglyceryl transferase [Tunturibacter empetritectus]|uniref:Prolipoprotein diacylglyceryl transferase n=1 Tax=Tunturiibacter empetritectus TaxID=3069691 RepID=A0AAU7ZI96_9BACT
MRHDFRIYFSGFPFWNATHHTIWAMTGLSIFAGKLADVTLGSHPELHTIFETLAYTLGYAVYRQNRSHSGDVLDDDKRWLIIAAAAVGALLGSRVLGLFEQAPRLHLTWRSLLLPGGKTIVGGLLGGWLAVELIKRLRGIQSRTGDLFAVPLCLGIAIGRIGCFLAGLADDTYGTPTSLPWAIDFGDGIPRHPTQVYEIVFLLVLALILHRYNQRIHPEGSTFRLFLAAYLSWRFLIDFIKPQPLVLGLNLIQWSCLGGLVVLAFGEFNWSRNGEMTFQSLPASDLAQSRKKQPEVPNE